MRVTLFARFVLFVMLVALFVTWYAFATTMNPILFPVFVMFVFLSVDVWGDIRG